MSNDMDVETKSLFATFEFTQNGFFRAVYPSASTDQEQKILEGAIKRITNPQHWGWFRKLLRRG